MAAPLVSVVIPTHNRPDYLLQAVASVQAQTYANLQILVTDNSTDEASAAAMAPLLAADQRISYLRCPEKDHPLDNWLNGLGRAEGRYVSYLMDDDLFAPQKIERMVAVFETHPDVGLVTSHRQLIDEAGRPLPPMQGTEHQFPGDTLVAGDAWLQRILLTGSNVIGEPTTVLMRRAELGSALGFCLGRQYQVLLDIATWIRLMRGRQVAYLHQSLSLFRIHAGQDQRRPLQRLLASLEWLQLLLDADSAGWFTGQDAAVRASLSTKLAALLPYIVAQADTLREAENQSEQIQRQVRQALDRLLH